MSKKHTGEGSYQINAVIERSGKRGESTYHDMVFFAEHAEDDQDAVGQWKKTLNPAVRIVRYTVIFLGLYLLGVLLQAIGYGG